MSASFAVLHAVLFLFRRDDRGNLHLAIAAGAFALASALRGSLVELAAVLIMILAFIRFAHWFTHDRPLKLLYAIWVVAAVLAFAGLIVLDSMLPFWLFVLASLVDLVRCLRRDAAHPQPGAWVVALGGLAVGITALIQTAVNMAPTLGIDLPIAANRMDIYSYGMLALFLAISVSLSWRYAAAQRDLEARLREVESLSALNLEQERQARELEVERRLLEADYARKSEELEGARRLQLSLLPPTLPDLPDLEIAFAMRTASEVGGDYYDYRNEHGGITVAVGDATGHGADSGILVATVKGLFHTTRLEQGLRPALERVSEGVAGLGLRRHHMSLALLRYSAGAVRFAAAGMPPLLVHRVASGEVEEIVLEAPPLGVAYARPYPELRSRVEPGDTLLITTDGLAERRNERDELFGYDRLRSAFAAAVRYDVSDIAERLFAASDQWAGAAPQSDDMTAAVLRVKTVPGASGTG